MTVAAAVEAYFADLGRVRASGGGTGERSSYGPLAHLLDAVGATLKPKVFCVGELADQGAGHPDFGLYTAKQVQRRRGRPREGQTPERGVVEVKAADDDAWLTAAGDQVSRYWSRYRLVLVTNTRDFVLVGEDAAGRAAKLETFRLADDADDFHRKLEKPRAFAREVGAGLGEYLCRALSHRAALAEPRDLAWLLASYARDGLARVEAAGDAPSLEAVRKALEDALGVRFEGEKGARFFRSTLVQTLFYGVFSAWVLWARAGGLDAPGNAGVSPAGVVGKAERVEAGEAPALPGSGPSASDLRSVAGETPAFPGAPFPGHLGSRLLPASTGRTGTDGAELAGTTKAGRAFLPRTPALPGESSTHEGHEPTENFAFPRNGAPDEPDPNPGESRTAPSGQIGRREAAEALARSAARGRELARLLDSDRPVPSVTTGALRPEVAVIAVPATTDGRNMAGGDFALTAGWGHYGAGGAVMPGQGRIVERAFAPEERAALGGTLPALGQTTFDVYLNPRAFWRNVPAAVWHYKLGGYQALKKWLSYREASILGRPLHPEEVQHFTDTARRMKAILLAVI